MTRRKPFSGRVWARFRRIVGDFDPLARPPVIEPVSGTEARPLWSVMIPTYNCAGYLRQTLESVLAQDPGPEVMQIEVVDDVSTKDDPEAIVRAAGMGRVAFHRKPRNEGVSRNFNTCIGRARGHLVHILHGDDYVLPGFYRVVGEAARRNPGVAAFFTCCRIVNEAGELTETTRPSRLLSAPGRIATDFYYDNPVRTPGAVIRRSFYEKHGGFRTDLVHTADWEMWVRAILAGGGLCLRDVLADYRHFEANDSNRLARSGESLRDRLRCAAVIAHAMPDYDFERYERSISRGARRAATRFARMGDHEAALTNERLWRQLTSWPRRLLHRLWDLEIGDSARFIEGECGPEAVLAGARSAVAKGRSVCIWGAGQAGRDCLARLRAGGIGVAGFVDQDPAKHGTTIEACAVIGPDRLETARRGDRPFVVVASMWAPDIVRQLVRMGFRAGRDYAVT